MILQLKRNENIAPDQRRNCSQHVSDKKKMRHISKWNSKSETVLILFSVSLYKNKAMGINNMGKWQRHLEETKI